MTDQEFAKPVESDYQDCPVSIAFSARWQRASTAAALLFRARGRDCRNGADTPYSPEVFSCPGALEADNFTYSARASRVPVWTCR